MVKKGKVIFFIIPTVLLLLIFTDISCNLFGFLSNETEYVVEYAVSGTCSCFIYYIDAENQPVIVPNPVLPWQSTFRTVHADHVVSLSAYNLDAIGSDVLEIAVLINDLPVLTDTDNGSGDGIVSVTVGPARIYDFY